MWSLLNVLSDICVCACITATFYKTKPHLVTISSGVFSEGEICWGYVKPTNIVKSYLVKSSWMLGKFLIDMELKEEIDLPNAKKSG